MTRRVRLRKSRRAHTVPRPPPHRPDPTQLAGMLKKRKGK